jgi:hypothetical protein
VIPNKRNIPGVINKYKLKGKDHMKATNINIFFEVKKEIIAEKAGKTSIIKVIKVVSLLV